MCAYFGLLQREGLLLMGQISSGVGLISGLPITDLVDQLIAVEARPRDLVEQRNAVLRSTQVAYQSINAHLLGLKDAAAGFISGQTFNQTRAFSSNESVLAVSSDNTALPGTYNLRVKQLVGAQQTVSRGYADTNATFVGSATLSFDHGLSRLDSQTQLDDLNGGAGIERGRFRIIDRAGNTSILNLSDAVTVDDVVEAINTNLSVSVIASVSGDGLAITDNTGLTNNDLVIADIGTKTTAASLGISGSSATGSIVGTAINTVSDGTPLARLNDGNGVRTAGGRTDFQITDALGFSFNINIEGQVTVGEVVELINIAAEAVSSPVTASTTDGGHGITLTDSSGGGPIFAVTAMNNSFAAADLGILQADLDGNGIIDGKRLIASINSKLLRYINGGQGLAPSVLQTRTFLADLYGTGLDLPSADPDIDIVDRLGNTHQVSLNAERTVGDLISTFNVATGGAVTLSITGDRFTVTDNTGGTGTMSLNTPSGVSTVLTQMGLSKSTTPGVLRSTTLLGELFDGAGLATLSDTSADIQVTDREGNTYGIDFSALKTVGDLTLAFNTTTAGKVMLSISDTDNQFVVTDMTDGTGNILVSDIDPSRLANKLGLDQVTDGAKIIGTVNTNPLTASSRTISSLNAQPPPAVGSGVGIMRITNRVGVDIDVDLFAVSSISDICEAINTAGAPAGISAMINGAGNGLQVRDASGGAGDLIISDLSGTIALALGLVGTFSDNQVDGGDIDLQYLTESRRIEDLGVTRGSFRIFDSSGNNAVVDLTQGNEVTIQDVLAEINSRGLEINARLNDSGDGILIEDLGDGMAAIRVLEKGSSTADDLGILGEAINAGADLDGSLESTVTITVTDTLNTVRAKINAANVGVSATIINDGSAGAPFRLSLMADQAGTDGGFVFDDGGLGMEAFNLAKAQDAVLLFGGADPADALVIHSQSNTLSALIPGATIDLKTTSDQPVQITLSRDDATILGQAHRFVDAYNELLDTINTHDSFNSDTEGRGLLLGDPTVNSVKQAIINIIIRRNTELSGQFTALSQIGLTVGAGGRLSLDENTLRDALETDFIAVEQLFTLRQTELDEDGEEIMTARGIGVVIDNLLERLTDPSFGPIQNRVDGINDQIRLNDRRIESLEAQLEAKRQRLLAQFVAMERALAQLQSQFAALSSFQPIAAGLNLSGGNVI